MVEVSVIVPTYNDEGTIETALQSLDEQTYRDFETIVIDDGDDATASLARGFGCTVIERDQTGIASALNRGIKEAKGKYIARQDADDSSEPERLQKEVEFLKSHPEVHVVGTGAYLWEDGRKRGRRRVPTEVDFPDLLEKNHLVHGSVLMRREAVERVGGYDEKLDHIEDLDLWLRLSHTGKICNIDEPLYNFFIHCESVYGSRLEEIKLYERYVRLRETTTIPERVKTEVCNGNPQIMWSYLGDRELSEIHRDLAMEHFRYGRPRIGRKHIKKTLRLNPRLLDYILLGVSILPPVATRQMANTYRLVLNRKIDLSNMKREKDAIVQTPL